MRFRLREAIAKHHQQAEELVEDLHVFSNSQNYAVWLSALQTVHSRFAISLDQASRRIGLQPISDRLHQHLSSDLNAIGWYPPHCFTAAVKPKTEAEEMGVAYVLEGSGLGAHVMTQRARQAGVTNIRYLEFLQEGSKARWPVVTRALEREGLMFEPTLSAAQSVFAFLTSELERRAL